MNPFTITAMVIRSFESHAFQQTSHTFYEIKAIFNNTLFMTRLLVKLPCIFSSFSFEKKRNTPIYNFTCLCEGFFFKTFLLFYVLSHDRNLLECRFHYTCFKFSNILQHTLLRLTWKILQTIDFNIKKKKMQTFSSEFSGK